MSGGLPAGQLPPGQDWIAREFRQLRREIRELRAEQRLAAAQVVDSAGQDVFKVTANPPEIFLRQDLITDLAVTIFGDRVKHGYAQAQTVTSSTSFGDGSSAGPSVTNVQIITGLAVVYIGASISYSAIDTSQLGGRMSVAVSGASTKTPSALYAASSAQSVTVTGATSWAHSGEGRWAALHVFDDLNPGTHQFDGKYQSVVSGQQAFFGNRIIVVIAL